MDDPRRVRSREVLMRAIAEYLEQGIAPSVTDIVTRAGVSRPTFYQHFGDLQTAYAETGLARIQDELDCIPTPDNDRAGDEQVEPTWMALTTHLYTHHTFYRTALREAGSRRLSERVIAFVAERIIRFSPLGAPYRDLAPGEVPDHILVLAAGLFALVGRWLDGDDPTPPAQMTQRIVAVFQSFSSRAVTD